MHRAGAENRRLDCRFPPAEVPFDSAGLGAVSTRQTGNAPNDLNFSTAIALSDACWSAG